jgi:hypothetical protein
MSTRGSSTQIGQGILTFTNLRTVFNEIQSPTISTINTTLTNLQPQINTKNDIVGGVINSHSNTVIESNA